MSKERIYSINNVEIETLYDVVWLTDYDVLIVNGTVIDEKFWNELAKKPIDERLKYLLEQRVTDYKFVEFDNGRVVALVQTKN